MNIEKLKTYYIYINKENSILQIKENMIPCNQLTETTSMIPKMNIIQQIQNMKKELVVHGHWPLACVMLDLISYFDKIRNEEEYPKNPFESLTITSYEPKTLW